MAGLDAYFGVPGHQLHVDVVLVVNRLSDLRPDLLSVVQKGVRERCRESGEGQGVRERETV